MIPMPSSSNPLGRNFRLHSALLLCVGLGLLGCGGPERTARVLLDDLLVGPPRFRLLSAGDAPVSIERALPGKDRSAGGQSMPALLLSSGCRVEFLAEPQGTAPTGQLRLLGALAPAGESAGVLAANPQLRLTGRLWIDGELVVEQAFEGPEAAGWRELSSRDGQSGLALQSGQQIELACTLEGASGEEVGLADLRLAVARLSLAVDVACSDRRSSSSAPNLVLVLSDTLRADHLSCQGHPRAITPHLDALASRGVRFENAYSTAPWTWPSTASLFTGEMPSAHGVTSSLTSDLASSHVTIAESLALAGLRTAAISGNPLIVPEHNFDQGFQRFTGTAPAQFRDAPELVPLAIEWIKAQGEQRFFLYLHLVDAHEPHDWDHEAQARFPGQKPAGYPDAGMVALRGTILRKRSTFAPDGTSRYAEAIDPTFLRYARLGYQRSIWTQDQWLGKLFASLQELGLEQRTVVAFTSDHGEEFLEHGGILHGDTLFEELVHVPLLLAGPGVPAGAVLREPVSNRHLAGTLARLLDVPFGGRADYDLLSGAGSADVRFENEHGRWHDQQELPAFGRRQGNEVLLLAPTASPWAQGPEEPPPFSFAELLASPQRLSEGQRSRLYDLANDPTQQRDLAAGLGAGPLTARLVELLQAFERDSTRRPPSLNQAGADVQAMLVEMGYVNAPEGATGTAPGAR
jgi:arylsulfatase A-like enzyme